MKHQPNTRSKIIREAKALFAKQDFEATSMSEIAKKVGIEKASLYYFYKDKESILAAVIEEIWGALAGTFTKLQKDYEPSGNKKKEREHFSSMLLFVLDALRGGGLVLAKIHSKELKKNPAYQKICQHVNKCRILLNSHLRRHQVRDPEVAEEIIAHAIYSYVMHAQYAKSPIHKKAYAARLASLFIN